MIFNYVVFYLIDGRLVYDRFNACSFDHAYQLSLLVFDCFVTSGVRILFLFRCSSSSCFIYAPVSRSKLLL